MQLTWLGAQLSVASAEGERVLLVCNRGVRGGHVIGATDDLGLYAVEDKLHVHDIHSTIFHLLGLDHTEVIYHHKGRPERVDLNEGHVYKDITA